MTWQMFGCKESIAQYVFPSPTTYFSYYHSFSKPFSSRRTYFPPIRNIHLSSSPRASTLPRAIFESSLRPSTLTLTSSYGMHMDAKRDLFKTSSNFRSSRPGCSIPICTTSHFFVSLPSSPHASIIFCDRKRDVTHVVVFYQCVHESLKIKVLNFCWCHD